MKKNQDTFKALSDDTRLRILRLLLVSKDPLCVCEIVDALRIPQYQTSRHLNILKQAGLVKVEKRGTWGYHSLVGDVPRNRLLFSFLEVYLTGNVYERDQRNLLARLRLREGGMCVVGFVSKTQLTKLIRAARQQDT